MTEIEIIENGERKRISLDQFFEDYWGLFRFHVIRAVRDELERNGVLRELIKDCIKG